MSFLPGFRGPRGALSLINTIHLIEFGGLVDRFPALRSLGDPMKPSSSQDAISELSERFIDLASLKANHRLKSLSKGQKYGKSYS